MGNAMKPALPSGLAACASATVAYVRDDPHCAPSGISTDAIQDPGIPGYFVTPGIGDATEKGH